jgi:chromosomal replication initiation ATPase DnaA
MTTYAEILSAVTTYRGVDPKNIAAHSRKAVLVGPRHEVAYLARTRARMSLPQIADKINRHHTSVMYAVASVEDRLDDFEYKADFDRMCLMLTPEFIRTGALTFKSVRSA